jgi:hypothetical protein
MAINIAKLAARLQEFEDGKKASEFSKLLWKPKEGTQRVRIVPYKYNPEWPFIELSFYYNLGGKHYLSPSTFGKPDPIQEVIDVLRSSGSNEEKEIAKKLQATPRTYVPIIVRGEEEQGVRYWGFGVQVYKELLKLMTNPEWGDITSYTEGNDIEVSFTKVSAKKNTKTGQAFPETKILALPRKTPVVDPTRRDLMEKVKEQTEITKIFPLKTYEELKDAVEKWLHPEDGADAAAAAEGTDTQEVQSESQTAAPVAATAPTTAAAAPAQGEAMAAEFEKFFKS